MSQDEVYEVIKSHPGILQSELKKSRDVDPRTVSEQIRALAKWKRIIREPVKSTQTYRLYAVVEGV